MQPKRIFPKPVTDESPKKSPFRTEAPVPAAGGRKAKPKLVPMTEDAPAPTPEAETGNEA